MLFVVLVIATSVGLIDLERNPPWASTGSARRASQGTSGSAQVIARIPTIRGEPVYHVVRVEAGG